MAFMTAFSTFASSSSSSCLGGHGLHDGFLNFRLFFVILLLGRLFLIIIFIIIIIVVTRLVCCFFYGYDFNLRLLLLPNLDHGYVLCLLLLRCDGRNLFLFLLRCDGHNLFLFLFLFLRRLLLVFLIIRVLLVIVRVIVVVVIVIVNDHFSLRSGRRFRLLLLFLRNSYDISFRRFLLLLLGRDDLSLLLFNFFCYCVYLLLLNFFRHHVNLFLFHRGLVLCARGRGGFLSLRGLLGRVSED